MENFLKYDWVVFGYWFAAHAATIILFVLAYMALTSYNDFRLIKEGKIAPAIALVAALLGLLQVILAVNKNTQTIIEFGCWAGIGMLVQLLVCLIFRGMLTKAAKEENIGLAVLYGGITYVVGQAVAHSI
jgi:putative membrane protein